MLTIAIIMTVFMGLTAGLFLNFSIAVMPGLARGSDTTFTDAMRNINRAIQNPIFALYFFGALALGIVATIMAWGTPAGLWFLIAAVLYILCLAVTFAVNIPLNLALDAADDSPATRAHFEPRWVRWNHVRTVLSLGALICACVGMVSV